MNKKLFRLLTLLFLIAGTFAEAQQTKKVHRIGFLSSASPDQFSHLYAAFQQGLGDLGYIEGQNIVIEPRWAEGKVEQLPDLAAELVRLKVDLIVSTGGAATALAAKTATTTIPIVFIVGGDVVRTGLIASLARPGGNLTGLSFLATELDAKRLELLQEVFPKVRRVGVLGDPTNPPYANQLKETQAAAKVLGLQVQILEGRGPKDFESAFLAMTREGTGALIVLASPIFLAHRKQIADLAVKSRLPGMYNDSAIVDAGGLMSYGTNIADVYRRAATYVVRILKGAKASRSPRGATYKVRVRNQFKNSESTQPDDPSVCAFPGG